MIPRPLRRVLLHVLPFALAVAVADAAEALRANDTVAVCGDSITEQKLYSVFMEEYLMMCQPLAAVRTHQIGWSGEAAPALLKRLDSDVLPFQPTVVTTLYGMNDAGYTASNPATVAAFRDTTEAIIRKLQKGGVRFVLIGSPGAVDSEKFKSWRLAKCTPEAYNQALADLGDAAKDAAAKTGAAYVDVHGVMMAAMAKAKAKYGVDYPFATDGVHPSFNGHLVMAYAFLKALGCDGDIGLITVDAKSATATASPGHKILAASAGRIEIESARYPFCFIDNPTNKESTRAVLDCVPFNEDLNRFRLVVKNLSTPRAVVRWGATEKTFTAAQLATGINLAAEFLDNPFNEAFSHIDAAVKAQQNFETPATKTLLHSLPPWNATLPEEKATIARLQSSVVEKSRTLAGDARRIFTPVRHILNVTPAL